MRHLKWATVTIAAAVVILSSTAAQATPFKFTFTSGVGFTSIPGTTTADTFTLSVIVDNGGDSLVNQFWLGASSATVTVGTYSASFLPPNSAAQFNTNGAGAVIIAIFEDIGGNDTDSLNGTPRLLLGGPLFTILPSGGRLLDTSELLIDARRWTVSAVDVPPVPEPSLLLLSGVALLPLLRRRRGTTRGA